MARPAMLLVKPADPAQLMRRVPYPARDHTEEMSFIQGMGNKDVVPNPWCNNLTIDKKFEYKNSKAMEGNLPYQYETTEESIGDAQKMFNGHN